MMPGKMKYIAGVLLNLLLGVITYGQSAKEEQHIRVSMRMIGHQILLNAGDSTSRVFPVEKEGESYKIQFGSAFAFNPADLAATVDRVVSEMKTAVSYIVEVKRCENDEVVYSYEKGDSVNPELMPCGPRFQSRACYMVFFTILKRYNWNTGSLYHAAPVQPALMENNSGLPVIPSAQPSLQAKTNTTQVKKRSGYSALVLSIGSVFAFIGLAVYFRTKKKVPEKTEDPDIIQIGNSRFDQRNMTLSCGDEKMELSSKESDLLALLYMHKNKTLERDFILKVVWGDEGDYVGRTLDVFISRLRKKLETDSRVKIANIRGIGYRFIVN